ncbi:hexose kinase [Georgenia sp. TF02-10]|uniref:1-phosphofructokinase family hexose kinase n=1 Tax=Georgenia sp. TF02-10 TaxID=2917725 RepID=UPI001FA6AE3D|nr:hexose kinase [Georgenia sp. TF02-10]UNX55180.1 hexose kinase [Georgenia sp. TF02-10]
MILTLTPNPAVDVTYTLPAVRLGEVNRVTSVTEAAGGKGVNVARVLAQLGHPVTATGFLGGDTGVLLRRLLDGSGVTQRWLDVPQRTRRTTTLVDAAGATLLNEPGPRLDPGAWADLAALLTTSVGAGDVVVVSGSTPPGAPDQALPTLLAAAAGRGARTLVDTSGAGLLAAADAGADLLKPNEHELAEATGAVDPVTGARALIDRGAGAVVVSCGAAGLVAVVADGAARPAWRARPAEVLSGNPTGAGDAAVAALALALHADEPLATGLPAHLPDAVALSGAAVLAPVAGAVDLTAYRRMRAAITVEELDAR